MTPSKPTDPLPSSVTPVDFMEKGSLERALSATARTQPMQGFDAEYTDIVDYILRCTHRIWEEKGVGLIYSHYSHNCVIHTAYGTTYGREQVVADTLRHLAAFPDRKLYGDDVIWNGDDQSGFHTSHRILTTAQHTGYGSYGTPTGRRLRYRTVAHCLVRENMIVEEWLVRDTLSIARQLGLDPFQLAQQMATADPYPELRPEGDLSLGRGQLPPTPYTSSTGFGSRNSDLQNFDLEDFVRDTWQSVWNGRMLNLVNKRYHPSFEGYWPDNRKLHGPAEQLQVILGVLATFSDAVLTVDHLSANGNEASGHRVAVRWTLTGTHDGHSIYGPPSGKRIRILGISHQHIQGGRIVREWTVYDGLALLKQLASPLE